MRFGLQPEVIEQIQAVFTRFEAVDTVLIYGSRAKGDYRKGSDIDLVVKLSPDAPAGDNLLFRIMDALDELNLVYTFDIALFDDIDQSDLLDHISRVGQPFYQRKTPSSPSAS